jgi:hypothetical protein
MTQDKAGKKPSTRFLPAVYRTPLLSKAMGKFDERAKPGLDLAGIIRRARKNCQRGKGPFL